ncbi:hypothetical protein KPL74_04805 [Bacillus sp. NP157]|nr:hypothetical protein KPL74_04805 [Bacillus sp. NP157]
MNEAVLDANARSIAISEISMEIKALSAASASRDWDEARFRAFRITDQAFDLLSREVATAGHGVLVRLGPPGANPALGFPAALLALVRAVDGLA